MRTGAELSVRHNHKELLPSPTQEKKEGHGGIIRSTILASGGAMIDSTLAGVLF